MCLGHVLEVEKIMKDKQTRIYFMKDVELFRMCSIYVHVIHYLLASCQGRTDGPGVTQRVRQETPNL